MLGADARAPDGLSELADILEVDVGSGGFIAVREDGAASRPGVYVAGSAGGPCAIERTLEQTQAAAVAALSHLDPRLLRTGVAAGEHQDAESASGPSESDLRARIERALFAILDRGD